MWAQMMACDTECSSVDKNMYEAVVSNYDPLTVAIFFLRQILWSLFINLSGVLNSFTIEGTTKYLLMGFKVILLTIFSNTEASSEQRSAYPFDEGISAA